MVEDVAVVVDSKGVAVHTQLQNRVRSGQVRSGQSHLVWRDEFLYLSDGDVSAGNTEELCDANLGREEREYSQLGGRGEVRRGQYW